VISPTQIGRIGERLVAAHLLMGSDGRLSPFEPVADNNGIDLLIVDKLTRRSLSLQVKSRAGIDAGGTVQFDVRRETFIPAPNAFLLAVLLDLTAVVVACSWLVAMTELERIAQPGSLTIVPRPKETSRDRYTPYRCHSMAEVCHRLTSALQLTSD
jgi:hypothetical protein